MSELKLTYEELHSATWLKLKAHYSEKLTGYRERNDHDSPSESTEKLRGRIAEVKSFLALETLAPEQGSE